MPKTAPKRSPFCFLSKTQLVKLRSKALRAGVWFRALPRIDRALVDLTIKVTSSVRSTTLAKNIMAVARKIEGLLECNLSRAFREVGFSLAKKLSLAALKWGNTLAKSWAFDMSFVNFLAVMHMNEHKSFKT